MSTFEKARIPSGARTLAGHYYTSSEIFAAERRAIFSRFWQCVGRSEALALPGAFFLAEVDGESLILLRDPSGHIRAFYNLCRHRGTRLIADPAGQLAGAIRCPYHAWTYRYDGSLAAAPQMSIVEGFDPVDWPLVPCAAAEWEGFVWVNLDPNPVPFAEYFRPLLGRFCAWNLADLRTGHRIVYDLACNWKLIFENYNECYHCAPIHPELVRLSPADSGRNDFAEGPFLGGYMDIAPGKNLTITGLRSRPVLGTVSGPDAARAYYYTFFPNVLFSLQPDYAMVHRLQPLAPERTRVVCEWYFDPVEMAKPDFDPSDAVRFWDQVNREDWQVSEWTQLGVASRAYTPGPLAHAEGISAAFDRYYLQVLGS